LFLTHRLPYAPNRGDRVRAYHLLRQLRTFADVDLISLVHDDDEARHLKDTEMVATTVTGVRVPRVGNLIRSALALPTSRPLSHTMLDGPDFAPAVQRVARAHRPDVVVAFCTGIAHVVLRALEGFPLVLDMVDVDSAKWSALAATARPPRAWIYGREARYLERFEIEITHRAAATILTTNQERDTLRALVPNARIEVMQNGVDAGSLHASGPPRASRTVVFCGVMNYPPNEEGAVWLAREVWPQVRQVQPEARLALVGSHPTRRVLDLAREGITVTGHVDDVRPYLWDAAVAAAPLLTARGVQNKVLEAVAAGLPVVVTPVVAAGVPEEVRPACDTAAGPSAFAAALIRLLALSPDDRRRRADRADVTSITWERRLGGLRAIVEAAARRS
jgi:sugar transferase (PEP-CTERM/EpsH1 system associated)